MKKYFMSILTAVGISFLLNIATNLLVVLVFGENSSFHRAISYSGSLYHVFVSVPAIYFASQKVFKYYKAKEITEKESKE
ncbi:MAG TPA: hypothetical protein VMU30_13045 [Bacteroidota bacterium]|nr:hypothetical protein [Bacteroidota bacterium]